MFSQIIHVLVVFIMLLSRFEAVRAEPVAAAIPTTSATSGQTLRKVLCLGDSLTEGYGVPRETSWPEVVQVELSRQGLTNIQVINAGISGSTSASGVARLKWFLKSKDLPEVLIVELGANDGLRGIDPQVTRKNLREVIQLAKSKGIRVLLAGMQMPTNYGPAYTKAFADIFPALAREEKVDFIPFFLEGVAGERSLNQPDGIHPNESGYKIIAKTTLQYLAPMIASPMANKTKK